MGGDTRGVRWNEAPDRRSRLDPSRGALRLAPLALCALALCALALCALISACGDPFHTEFAPVEDARSYQRSATATPEAPAEASVERERELRVMTYNVKFGGGRIDFFFDCHGDRVLMSRSEVVAHLERLAAKIRQVDPDVLFLQEVDVNSKRSAFVDQLQWLLDHTALRHGSYASQWKADFVPSDGLGAVDSGNAILSRYPLAEGTRIALDLRTDQSGLERYFYLRRNLLRASLEHPSGVPVQLVVVHTAAYSQDGTKQRHIERFKRELDELSSQGLVVGGGDLNALPPGSDQVEGFDDSACTDEFEADDYSAEGDWLAPLYADYRPAIALEAYAADNSRFFTHTTRADGFWNRKLDYLFTNGRFRADSALTHQDATSGGVATMPLSDHAPISVTLEIE